MNNSQRELKKLKAAIWLKVIGTEEFQNNKSYYTEISHAIYTELNEKIHWHTIRNFFEGRNTPSIATLNILSTFVLGGPENLKTWSHFQEHLRNEKTGIAASEKRKVYIRKPVILYASIVLLGTILIIGLTGYLTRAKNKEFSMDFQSGNLISLKEQGWFLIHENLDQWEQTQQLGRLQIGTFLGDSYLSNYEYEPRIPNILTHRIYCGECCTISIMLKGFNPYQRYQQAGFFLFYGNVGEEIPSVRMTFANNGKHNNVTAFYRDAKYSTSNILATSGANRWRIANTQEEVPSRMIDSIELKIRIQDDNYFFYRRINNENEVSIDSKALRELGSPTYIGLTAFQGRPDIPYPVFPVADTIPAHFAWVKIEACNRDD